MKIYQAQVVKCLPNKCEALNSSPSTAAPSLSRPLKIYHFQFPVYSEFPVIALKQIILAFLNKFVTDYKVKFVFFYEKSFKDIK
jgi:hypothetical protein